VNTTMAETPSRLRGMVASSGSVRGGAGFAIEKDGRGAYTLTFTTPYSEAPVVVVTPAAVGRVASVAPSSAGARVMFTDVGGTPADSDFGFVVEPL
jgi:hypothetical protein